MAVLAASEWKKDTRSDYKENVSQYENHDSWPKKNNSMIVSLTTSAISLSRTNGFTSKDSLVPLKACGILLCACQSPKQLEDYIKHPTAKQHPILATKPFSHRPQASLTTPPAAARSELPLVGPSVRLQPHKFIATTLHLSHVNCF